MTMTDIHNGDTPDGYECLKFLKRSDGYDFYLYKEISTGNHLIRAGCQAHTLKSAWLHWGWYHGHTRGVTRKYYNPHLYYETFGILLMFERKLKIPWYRRLFYRGRPIFTFW